MDIRIGRSSAHARRLVLTNEIAGSGHRLSKLRRFVNDGSVHVRWKTHVVLIGQ